LRRTRDLAAVDLEAAIEVPQAVASQRRGSEVEHFRRQVLAKGIVGGLLRNHVVAFIELLQEPRDLGWIVLDVGIILVFSTACTPTSSAIAFPQFRRNLMVVPQSLPPAISLMIFQEASDLPSTKKVIWTSPIYGAPETV
jgi:hypothetical protein